MGLEEAIIFELNELGIEKCEICGGQIFDIDYEKIVDSQCEYEIKDEQKKINNLSEEDEGDVTINIKEVRCKNKKCEHIIYSTNVRATLTELDLEEL